MNRKTFNDAMEKLPMAFPTNRILMSDGIKNVYWDGLKGYSDVDFDIAITEIQRHNTQFPNLPVIIQKIEENRAQKEKSDLSRRMEEHQARKAERITAYTPRDTDSAYEKQHAKDTFAMIQEGLSNSDMISALVKLGEKYPREKWIPKLISEMRYEKAQTVGRELQKSPT